MLDRFHPCSNAHAAAAAAASSTSSGCSHGQTLLWHAFQDFQDVGNIPCQQRPHNEVPPHGGMQLSVQQQAAARMSKEPVHVDAAYKTGAERTGAGSLNQVLQV